MAGTERYMTLSHRWGLPGSAKIKLTHDHIQSFCDNIDFSALPPSFQDTIHIVHSLGVQYLWIDALCIIQDFNEDWLREAATMSEVYGNSYLNIAALDAPAPKTGFFFERRIQVPEDVIEVEVSWTGDLTAGRYFCHGMNLYETSLDASALSQRAWFVQERQLAPRILHFTRDHIFWECDGFHAIDSLPQGIDAGVNLKTLWPLLPTEPLPDSSAVELLYDYWAALVKRYSTGDLTYVSDKLIAISALAKTMMRRIQAHGKEDTYLAGLWKSDLKRGLLWSVLPSRPFHNDYGVRIQSATPSPSWSWTSLHGATIWYPNVREEGNLTYEHRVPDPVIEDAKTFPIGDDFGPVNGGFIRIRGPLCQVTASLGEDHQLHHWRINGGERQDAFESVRMRWDSLTDHRGLPEILVLMIISANENTIVQGRAQGLLLLPTQQRNGQYERLGQMDINFGDGHEYTQDDVDVWTSHDMEAEYYEKSCGDGWYTISII